MVTLKDIAQACGVSVSTVSRALNGKTDPDGKNPSFIRRAAKEMGYYPNAAAIALKTSRFYNIGVVYEDRMDHEYFSCVLNDLRSAAEEKGYDLTLARRPGPDEHERYMKRAIQKNLDGVIVVQADFDSEDVVLLITSPLPTVVIDHAYKGCDCILGDNQEGMEALVRRAYALGHRKIAFIRGHSSTVTRERINGFYKACAELGILARAEYLPESSFHDPEGCASAALSLMEMKDRPTCILCPDDFSCIGALHALNEKGFRVPEDVSLAGYDGIRAGQMMIPRLATYYQDTRAIALKAVELLTRSIEQPGAFPPQSITVSGTFLPGDTLGPVPSP